MTRSNENILPITLGNALRTIDRWCVAQWATGERFAPTPMLMGPPGVGKTASLRSQFKKIGKRLGLKVLVKTVIVSDREVTDIRGIGVPRRNAETGAFDRMDYTRSGVLAQTEELADYDKVVYIFDEVPAATLDHVKALAAVLLEYTVGETHLDPKDVYICATGNHTTHRSGALKLPAHVINRMALFHVEADVDAYLKFASSPDSGVPGIGAAFVHTRPTIFTEAEVPSAPNVPFPTFRSFTNGVRSLLTAFAPADKELDVTDPNVIEEAMSPDNIGLATTILAASVGASTAREFLQYARVRTKLTPLEVIMNDPKKAPLPGTADVSAMFAQSLYVASWCTDKKRAAAMLIYVGRMREDLRIPTVQRMALTYKTATGNQLTTVPGYADMLRENIMLAVASHEE